MITNATGSPKIRFNQRYVNDEDAGGLPSFGVSIATVNGKAVSGPDAAGSYVLGDLLVPGVNEVPVSMVVVPPSTASGSRPWSRLVVRTMQPSQLTHEPRPPTAPRTVTGVALKTGRDRHHGAVRVRWDEPDNLGGLPVLEYVVTANPGGRHAFGRQSPSSASSPG